MKAMIDTTLARTPIRSYMRREHRMTPGQARALQQWWPEYGRHVADGWFECQGECILEVGFGMGRSLLAMAAQFPEKTFIGVEVHRPGIGALMSVAARNKIKNIYIYQDDVINVFNQSIKDKTLSKIQIFFPDPWPKNRHQKRRLIQPEFAQLMQQKLKPEGLIHLATDCQDYARHMLAVLGQIPQLSNCADSTSLYLSHRAGRPVTKFEQRALDQGRPVWDLLFLSAE